MQIEQDVKLDFKDVLLQPKRSNFSSRNDISIERQFTFKYGKHTFYGVPIIAANMDTVGTIEMSKQLSQYKLMTALHKFYSNEQVNDLFDNKLYLDYNFYTIGIRDEDYQKFNEAKKLFDIKYLCIDVPSAYLQRVVDHVRQIRSENPDIVLMVGNVVTGNMTEELILAGADIVKCGIGPGSNCTTRIKTGVGVPQLSTVIECADAAHGLGGLICSDGGCTNPGDVAKAFCAGADFVMLGGMLAGHDECGSDIVIKRYLTNELDADDKQIIEEKKFMLTYGMSSEYAMKKYYNGVANYKASEGKTSLVPYKGKVENTIKDILGGLRSTCSYIGAKRMKDMSKCATFVRVNQQSNEIFGKN